MLQCCLTVYSNHVLGPAIAINSISVTSSFCCTGSEDGFLRLWPLDFSAVFLEAGRLLSPPGHELHLSVQD